VLSQYLTAVNCAGSMPPQETGLVCNSWHGKFHLEMHWWHAAHFVLWGRAHLLERSLPCYQRILPVAQATARRQGYRGARWPKEVGPDGREAPGTIGPFLIWQQPHPIYYAELLWRAHRDRETLERYREIVFETAEFMASFPEVDGERYILAPPLIPAQESYAESRTTVVNPTFELAYWSWELETALARAPGPLTPARVGARQARLGRAPAPRWGLSGHRDGALHHPQRSPLAADGAGLGAPDPADRPTDHAADVGERQGELGLAQHLGLGLPGAGDVRGPARRPFRRGRRSVAAHAQEHLLAQRP
jgi:hypothetical protein